jgi:hypothetical protein
MISLVISLITLGDKEQIGVEEPFPVANLPISFIKIRTKKFFITKFD